MIDENRAAVARWLMGIAGVLLVVLILVAWGRSGGSDRADWWIPLAGIAVGVLAVGGILILAARMSLSATTEVAERAHRRLISYLPVSVIALAAAVVALNWPAETVPRVTSPTLVDIRFIDDQMALGAAGIPVSCAGVSLTVVAIDGTFLEPVVTRYTHNIGSYDPTECPLSQHRIRPGLAAITPLVERPKS